MAGSSAWLARYAIRPPHTNAIIPIPNSNWTMKIAREPMRTPPSSSLSPCLWHAIALATIDLAHHGRKVGFPSLAENHESVFVMHIDGYVIAFLELTHGPPTGDAAEY